MDESTEEQLGQLIAKVLSGERPPEVKSFAAIDSNKALYGFGFSKFAGAILLEGTFVGSEFKLTGHGATVKLTKKDPGTDISGTNYGKFLSDPSMKSKLGMDEAYPEVKFLQAVQGAFTEAALEFNEAHGHGPGRMAGTWEAPKGGKECAIL